MAEATDDITECEGLTHHFDFLLVDGHSGLSLISAVETLKNTNLVSGRELYSWRMIGLGSGEVISSTGQRQTSDDVLANISPGKDVVLVSGEDAYNADISQLKVWLSKYIRSGVRITALGTGAILLGRVGLLKQKEVAIHPWYRVGFAEKFPDTNLSRRTHVSAGNCCSASGGTSSIDLFLDFVEQDHGKKFSDLVADCMCYRQTRRLQAAIDLSVPSSISILHPVVSKAVSMMEQNLEFPVSPSRLATDLNMSTRQLERLFKKYIGQSPKRHNMRIRVEEAYRLLVQTRFDITQVALMTGFTSPSHFSKCFKAQFGFTPHDLRRKTAE